MTPTSQHRHGFTLVELLVSMTVGSVLLFLAATLLGRAGDSYDRGSGSVAAEREARAVLTQMGEDFGKAEWHKDTIFEAGGEGWKRARVGFLSLQAEDAQTEDGRTGDLCAVHYYIKDIKVGTGTVRCLMRGFRESGEVFPALKSDSFTSLFAEEDTDEPVAFGVLSFEAKPMRRDPFTRELEDRLDDPEDRVTDIRIRLVIARRELLGKLSSSAEWDSSPLRGKPDEAINNPDLEIYEVIQRFGNDA